MICTFMEETARAVEETGIRAVLCRGLIGLGPEADSGLEDSRRLVEKMASFGRRKNKLPLGSPCSYTCPLLT